MVEVKIYSKNPEAISMLTRLAFTCGGVGATRRAFDSTGKPNPYCELHYSFGAGSNPGKFLGAVASLDRDVSLEPIKD